MVFLYWLSIEYSVPVLVVDPRAVEQGSEKVLVRTQAVQDHCNPIHGGQQKHRQGEQEAAVVALSNTAVYPKVRGEIDTPHIHNNTTQQPVNLNPHPPNLIHFYTQVC